MMWRRVFSDFVLILEVAGFQISNYYASSAFNVVDPLISHLHTVCTNLAAQNPPQITLFFSRFCLIDDP